jgi:hypothetical protein
VLRVRGANVANAIVFAFDVCVVAIVVMDVAIMPMIVCG